MTQRNKDKLQLLAVFVVGILLVGAIGAVKGYVGSAPKVVVEGDYIEATDNAAQDESFGGEIHNYPESFDEGIQVDLDTVIDGYGRKIRSDVEEAFNFVPTSTHAYEKFVEYKNPGGDVIVEDWYLDFSTPLNSMSGQIACGTTTDTATGYYTATNTATILQKYWISTTFDSDLRQNGLVNTDTATSTGNIGTFFTAGGLTGTPSSTAFMLKTDEDFVCSFTAIGTASSTDYSTKSNFTGAGYLHMTTKRRAP